ncbi:hypothetical protein L484_000971 [Morus notabilis]|uniref:Uncharacterized protein n=1 Tax=Morus notabilis TaxID=981085 RepID=W9S0Z9_9ROSA|nr:hypothetical protein L484_000971 [Morus notabilis]
MAVRKTCPMVAGKSSDGHRSSVVGHRTHAGVPPPVARDTSDGHLSSVIGRRRPCHQPLKFRANRWRPRRSFADGH